MGIFPDLSLPDRGQGDAPYSTMAELAEFSKANEVRLGHFGYGIEPTMMTFFGMQELGGNFSAEAAFDAVDCSTLANGDADVINTTAQLVLPCLSEIKVLATITGGERTAITPMWRRWATGPALAGSSAVERPFRAEGDAAGGEGQDWPPSPRKW